MDLGTAAGVAASLALQEMKTTAGAEGQGVCPSTPLQDTNVSAVQDALVGVYHQRIHGPIATTN